MHEYKSKFAEDVPGLVTRENDVLKDKIGNVQKTLDTMYYDMVEILSDTQEIEASEFLATVLKKYRDTSNDLRRILAEIKRSID